ncbi:DUF4982 domain-containing protein [Pelagicoccus mobilis]|uniref:DUF4982 domain-containing protein n=2 Tax=Pelagicoccus mobilis TaxID=415221 RepID=A0A934S3G7_9BACT|nr:DUF4982 domain-containing protein [Pelagicoccus mobilis]
MGKFLLPEPGSVTERPDSSLGGTVEYVQADYDDSEWRELNLPHDWGIEGPFDLNAPGETAKLPWQGIGWYRKQFEIDEADLGGMVFLDIDGAMANPLIWCNGAFVGGWRFGYASFRVDLTPHLRAGGDNLISIRLENLDESSRWYPGSGLYRNVWLVKSSRVHVEQWGVHVTTPKIEEDSALVCIETVLNDETGGESAGKSENAIYAPNTLLRPLELQHRVFEANKEGLIVGEALVESARETVEIQDGFAAHSSICVTIDSPKLWSPHSPSRYVVETQVWEDGQLQDRVETLFGVRSMAFDADNGFLLNGERVMLQGVCLHHDHGALGAAFNVSAMRRQLLKLQEMGCNAIRTSHNPGAPEMLDLCDELGIFVIGEAFDCWALPKKENDYCTCFQRWHERDLRAMVRRDRNHPSVIIWSIGNEIAELWHPEGWKLGRRLSAICKEEDSSRLTTAGYNFGGAGFDGMQAAVDVTGFNYKPDLYAEFHERNPTRPVYGSETSSCISTRGAYFFPFSDERLEGRKDFQVSSTDLHTADWAFTPDAEFKGLDENPCAAGEFVWTGFDYLGEPTPFNADMTNLLNFSDLEERERIARELEEQRKNSPPSRSSYFGIIDLAGFEKDRFFLYQARWRPQLPMAHILPHWDWPEREGEHTPVQVYSSGDEAELFINGRSLGRQKRGPLQYRFRWDEVYYEPGEIRVETYKDGEPWATASRKTPGPASNIVLEQNYPREGEADLTYVAVSLADEKGVTLPRATDELSVQVEGGGELIATDNGDPTRLEPFQSSTLPLFYGKAIVIIRRKPDTDAGIKVKVVAAGLPEAELSV